MMVQRMVEVKKDLHPPSSPAHQSFGSGLLRYLGVHKSKDLIWSGNTSYPLRKANQRLHFRRKQQGGGLRISIL